MIKLIVVGFCSPGSWCYSGWWVWDLRTLAQFQVYSETLWMALIMDVVVMTVGSQSRPSQIASYGSPIFNFRFIKFVFKSSGSLKFLRSKLKKTPIPSVLVQLLLELNTYLLFSSDKHRVENRWRGGVGGVELGKGDRKHCFVNFSFLALL